MGLVFGIAVLSFARTSSANGFEYVDMGVGGTAAFGQVRETQSSPGQQRTLNRDSVDGGAVLFLDSALYFDVDSDGVVVMLWEEEMALRILGGYGFGTGSRGYGGFEFRGNGDIGMSFFGLLPLNQALEDTKLRVTEQEVEGKTLIGTTHVLPLDIWSGNESDDQMVYLSLSHGFRYHSELHGWTWALQPKFRLVNLEHLRLEARALFGFWHQNRRERSGSLAVDIPIGEKVLISAFGEAEHLKQAKGRGEQIGWTAGVDIAVHFLDD